MAAETEPFLSVQKKDYNWPSNIPPISKPSQPPVVTKPPNYYVAQMVEGYCHCDAHLYEPIMMKYERLGYKEKLIKQDLNKLYEEMANLGSDILDQPCDNPDIKMKTIYQIDYIKRGKTPVIYQNMMAATDDLTVKLPCEVKGVGLGNGYRDPTFFRYSCFRKPEANACAPLTYSKTPQSMANYHEQICGKTEYQDTISKNAISILRNSQQFLEPLPSSRRRFGDLCF